MRPAEKKTGVILDQYSEVDLLKTVVNTLWAYIPGEVADDVEKLIPEADLIMHAHKNRFRRFWRKRQEVPETNLFLSPRQVAAASVMLTVAVLTYEYEIKDPLLSENALQMQIDMAVNLQQSRVLRGALPREPK